MPGSIWSGVALCGLATACNFEGFLVGMASGGLGFGVYMAVDLALVVDVLPAGGGEAKNLGVFNIAAALPFYIGTAVASGILAIAGGGYDVVYAVAVSCALLGAAGLLPAQWRR